jgi:hypothetical protein
VRVPQEHDWRLTGQEAYLTGVTLAWRSWSPPAARDLRAWRLSDGTVMQTTNPDTDPPTKAVEELEPHEWDHDHCEFCWTKFMAANYPPERREWRDRRPEILAAGYTLAEPGARRIWICPTCFHDFRDHFGWTVTSAD